MLGNYVHLAQVLSSGAAPDIYRYPNRLPPLGLDILNVIRQNPAGLDQYPRPH